MATIVQQTNGEKTIFKADEYSLIMQQLNTMQGVDTNSTVLTRDTSGRVSQIQVMNGSSVLQTTTINRDSNGTILTIVDALNGKTIITTLNRDSLGNITSISKVAS